MSKETISFRPSKENVAMLGQLEALAKAENRSLNNYIETVLLETIKRKKLNSYFRCPECGIVLDSIEDFSSHAEDTHPFFKLT